MAASEPASGHVVIQTYTPNHRVIEQVIAHDYEGMFMTEIKEVEVFLFY
ncbi:hypothetical protein [Sphingobacterium sp. JB170]|nr:hypothetical protein [Sphingobacterium sp. JB170]SJN46281.1 Helicase PriA essential for oriC/DnaA-independent DNA replication [Sphingobacterium sp. JB170]